MFLDKFINQRVFIVAFFISLVIVYFVSPEPNIIIRHPTPENAGKLTYTESTTNTCYKYQANEVKCPSDPDLIIEHPLIIH